MIALALALLLGQPAPDATPAPTSTATPTATSTPTATPTSTPTATPTPRPARLSIDLLGSWTPYAAQANAFPQLWGPAESLDLASLRLRIATGGATRLALTLAGGADAIDPDIDEFNLVELEALAGVGRVLVAGERIELTAWLQAGVVYRELSARWWGVGVAGEGLVTGRWRVAGPVALQLEAAARLGMGGPRSAASTSAVSGTGMRLGAGLAVEL